MGKAPTITAGPASSNDAFSISEDQSAAGSAVFNVLLNDTRKSTLYSLDNGEVADLTTQDAVLAPQISRLGATIAITADGQVSYAFNSPLAQGLASGQSLQDSFIYAIRLQSGALVWSTVTVTITGTNDAPVARADVASATEDAIATGSVATNDSDVDNGAVLSFGTTDQVPAGFVMSSNGSWALDTSLPAYQSLAAGQTMQAVVQYWVTDQHGASSSSTLTLTIAGQNDAPVAVTANAGAAEGQAISGQLTATDVDQASGLSFALNEAAPVGFVLNPNGNWTFDASAPEYQALGEGETRAVQVRYAAVDSAGARGNAILTITVTGTNDGPVATPATANVEEDQSVSGTVIATDADATANLIFEPYGVSPDGFSMTSNGSWTFDANLQAYQSLAEGQTEDISIDYVVTDDQGATSVSTLLVTITGTNDAPVTTSQWIEANEDQSAGGALMAFDVDEGGELTFAVVGDAPAGFSLNADGSWTFDGSHTAYASLGDGEVQLIEVPFSVVDDHDSRTESFVMISVAGANDAPVQSGTLSLPDGIEDTAYTVTQAQLLAGWGDADGDGLMATNLTATNAAVTDNGDGSFTIMPAANANGAFELKYVVTDGRAPTITTAGLTILPVNDPATNFTGSLAGSVREDRVLTATGNVDFVDNDNPSDQWTAITIPAASAAGYGSYTLSAGGQWSYALDNANPAVAALATGESLTDSIVLTTADGTTTAVSITINGRTDVDYVSPAPSTDTQSEDNDTLFSDSAYPFAPRTYSGGPFDDTIHGSIGNDRLTGNDGYDRIYGHDGDDTIYGDVASGSVTDGNDQLYGQAGNDVIYGGSGDDRIFGGSGNDILYANGTGASEPLFASNRLHGGSGDDQIYGGGGRDIITGGLGADYLVGGAERDQFYFHSAAETGDTIADFQQGIDHLMINNLYLSRTNFVGQLTGAGQVENGEVGYYVSNGVTTIYIDTDGVAGADLEIHLLGTYALTVSDFDWTG